LLGFRWSELGGRAHFSGRAAGGLRSGN